MGKTCWYCCKEIQGKSVKIFSGCGFLKPQWAHPACAKERGKLIPLVWEGEKIRLNDSGRTGE